MGLTASEFDLSKVFSVDYQYEVPTYQRPYSWTVDETITLLDDLAAALESPGVPYFLGSVVLVRKRQSLRVFDIIDGQQRLTTLVILLSVLRQLETDVEIRSGLEMMINEPGNKLLGIEAEPRLHLRERDRAFFRQYLQDGSLEDLIDLSMEDLETPAQRRIKENMQALYEALSNDFDAEKRKALAFYMTRQVFLVMIVSDDFASAHRIFGVLNSRGLPLTASDIFKSRVVGAVPEALRGEYSDRWDSAALLLQDSTDTFFQHLFVIEARSDVSINLVEDFPQRVLERFVPGRGGEFIDEVLIPYAQAFAAVRMPTGGDLDPRVSLWLGRLDEYPTSDWTAAAMWIVRNVQDVDEAVELLRLLERVTGIDTAGQVSRPQRRARIVRIVRELSSGESTRAGGFQVTDTERRQALARLHGEMSKQNRSLVKIYLARANDEAAGGHVEPARSVHVARVLPFKPTTSVSWEGLSDTRRAYWRDRLANLALGTVSDAKLKAIDDFGGRVAAVLDKSRGAGYPLTNSLAEVPAWIPEALEERQRTTIELLANFWNVRRDSEGFDLAALTEEQLSVMPGGGTATRARRLRTSEILQAGLLVSGETLVWDRPQLGERYTVTITPEGGYKLPNGEVVENPSAAARLVAGQTTMSGLRVWRREADGRLLADIWETYRRRLVG